MAPAIIPGASEDGTLRFIVNTSSPSTMVSFITVMCIVLLLAPAVITAICVVELKSILSPETAKQLYFTHVRDYTSVVGKAQQQCN